VRYLRSWEHNMFLLVNKDYKKQGVKSEKNKQLLLDLEQSLSYYMKQQIGLMNGIWNVGVPRVN